MANAPSQNEVREEGNQMQIQQSLCYQSLVSITQLLQNPSDRSQPNDYLNNHYQRERERERNEQISA